MVSAFSGLVSDGTSSSTSTMRRADSSAMVIIT
jgi:hypothetical protein